jgi:hypothetical protein
LKATQNVDTKEFDLDEEHAEESIALLAALSKQEEILLGARPH